MQSSLDDDHEVHFVNPKYGSGTLCQTDRFNPNEQTTTDCDKVTCPICLKSRLFVYDEADEIHGGQMFTNFFRRGTAEGELAHAHEKLRLTQQLVESQKEKMMLEARIKELESQRDDCGEAWKEQFTDLKTWSERGLAGLKRAHHDKSCESFGVEECWLHRLIADLDAAIKRSSR